MRRLAALLGLLLWACATARNPEIYREGSASLYPVEWTSEVRCRSSRECPERTYCARLGCDGPSACLPMPEISRDMYQPVCGCDGKVYGYEDSAHDARVSVSHWLKQGESSGGRCEPHFVCRDHEQHEGVVCPVR